jgi:predicted nucleic acid-binding protein
VIYLDTSVLGALFFREPTAPAILARLETVGKDDLCVSAWNLAEMASVGAIKERTGSIDTAGRAVGLTAFNRFVSDSLSWPSRAVGFPCRHRAAGHARVGFACGRCSPLGHRPPLTGQLGDSGCAPIDGRQSLRHPRF